MLKYLFLATLTAICISQAVAQASVYSYISTLDGAIYKADLANCTADSIVNLGDSAYGNIVIYDIALSPGGKLYVLDNHNNIFLLNLTTLSLSAIGHMPGNFNSNSLVCDSIGNLLTVTLLPPAYVQAELVYIDTLTAALGLICPLNGTTAGDLVYYQGDIYYPDPDGILHHVTLNPVHDYTLGHIGCDTLSPFGLTVNVTDTGGQPSIFAYSVNEICIVSSQTGSSIPYCGSIIPNIVGVISGAASVSGPGSGQTLYVPNAFTPNGDGNNDVFHVYANGVARIDCYIFDRWGEKVDEFHNITDGWNGEYKGRQAPIDVYVYSVDLVYLDGSVKHAKGSFTLIR
jgi:gliding motility-associated-like protein